jgi:hypothetical protein
MFFIVMAVGVSVAIVALLVIGLKRRTLAPRPTATSSSREPFRRDIAPVRDSEAPSTRLDGTRPSFAPPPIADTVRPHSETFRAGDPTETEHEPASSKATPTTDNAEAEKSKVSVIAAVSAATATEEFSPLPKVEKDSTTSSGRNVEAPTELVTASVPIAEEAVHAEIVDISDGHSDAESLEQPAHQSVTAVEDAAAGNRLAFSEDRAEGAEVTEDGADVVAIVTVEQPEQDSVTAGENAAVRTDVGFSDERGDVAPSSILDHAAQHSSPTVTNGPAGTDATASGPSQTDVEDFQVGPRRYNVPTSNYRRLPGLVRKKSTRKSLVTSLRAEIRLLESSGFYSVTVLLRRGVSLPSQMRATSNYGDQVELVPLTEEWYCDLDLRNLAEVLSDGLELRARVNGSKVAWVLGGREVYVLGPRSDMSGWISMPRLVIGQTHSLLCHESSRDGVARLLRDCGTERFNEIRGHGIPDRWLLFTQVRPTRHLVGNGDFQHIAPNPDIDIQLTGGIRIDRNTWLAGHAPTIHVFGAIDGLQFFVDGEVASVTSERVLTAREIHSIGKHLIAGPGISVVYSIAEASEDVFDAWPAFTFGSRAICGSLVLQDRRPILGIRVSRNHPVLIGSNPGEIYLCREDERVGDSYFVSPPFQPLLAIPRSPLLCDKRNSSVFVFETSSVPSLQRPVINAREKIWLAYLSDCAHKNLACLPDTESCRAKWKQIRRAAKAMRKRSR